MFGLNDVLRAIRARWWLVLGGVLVGLALSGALHTATARTYVSSTELLISVPRTDDAPSAYQGALFTKERLDSYARLLTTSQLGQQVADDLGSPLTAEEIASKVTALPLPNTDILEVTVTDSSPERAQAIAASLARAFDQTVTALETPSVAQGSLVAVEAIEPATFEPTPVGPSLARNMVLGGILGLALGIALALARQRMDGSVHSAADVRDATGPAPVTRLYEDRKLSRVPLAAQLTGSSPSTRALRSIGTQLQHTGGVDRPSVIVVTSAAPGEGKSTVAVGVAVSLARSGCRVLLVDGNLWRPRITRYLGVTATDAGLTDVLAGDADSAEVIVASPVDSLSVLPAGPMPEDPGELLGSAAMQTLLATLRESYDYIVIDAPALLPVVDAAGLGAIADGCVLVTRHGETRRDDLAEAATALAAVKARVLGVVLNRVPRRAASRAERQRYAPDASRRSTRGGGPRSASRPAPADDPEPDILATGQA